MKVGQYSFCTWDMVHWTRPMLKVGFHYPSWRPELSGVKKCRQLGPWTRAVNSGSGNRPLEFSKSSSSSSSSSCSFIKTMTNCIVTTCKTMNEKLKLIKHSFKKHPGNKTAIIIKHDLLVSVRLWARNTLIFYRSLGDDRTRWLLDNDDDWSPEIILPAAMVFDVSFDCSQFFWWFLAKCKTR